MKLNTGFRSLLLLAPPQARIPDSFRSVAHDPDRYEDLLHQTQALRGSIYLEDGAIHKGHLTAGRHVTRGDRHSWHLLVLDDAGKVCGCTHYRHHAPDVAFSQLTAAESSLALCSTWGDLTRTAVEEELALSRSLDLPFVEVGGWAMAEEIRGTVEALRMVLASYAFFRTFGGAVGLATATTRHSSASILRRIGGRPLKCMGQLIPSYLDSNYNCEMEMLRFYSWAPNPRYDGWIREIGWQILKIPVISCTPTIPAWMPLANPAINRQIRPE